MKRPKSSSKLVVSPIDESLEMMDSIFTKVGRPLRERPLRAARFIVSDLMIRIVVDGKDQSKENFWVQPWFADLYAHVVKWYEKKYGAAMDVERQLEGVVQIHSMPFRVRIPATRVEPDVPGETVWVDFSVKLGESEKPLKWIESPPNLGGLTKSGRERLLARLAHLVEHVRLLNLNLTMSGGDNPKADGLRKTTLLSLRKVVDHIVDYSNHSAGAAIWEMHYAIETALKAIVAKHGQAALKDHDLRTLLSEAKAVAPVTETEAAFSFLPGWRTAVNHRYGLEHDHGKALAAYPKFLALMSSLSEHIRGDIDLRGGQLKIAKAPWLATLLREDAEKKKRPRAAPKRRTKQRKSTTKPRRKASRPKAGSKPKMSQRK